jgi:hypothetical protein
MEIIKSILLVTLIFCTQWLLAMEALQRKQVELAQAQGDVHAAQEHDVREQFIQMKQHMIREANPALDPMYQATQEARKAFSEIGAINKNIDQIVVTKKGIKDAIKLTKEEKAERLTSLRKQEAELKKEREKKYAALHDNIFLQSKNGHQLKDEIYKAAHKK